MDRGILRDAAREAAAIVRTHPRVLIAYTVLGAVVPWLMLAAEPVYSMRAFVTVLAGGPGVWVSGSVTGPLYLLGIILLVVLGARMAALIAVQAELREGVLGEVMTGLVAGVSLYLAHMVLVLLLLVPFFALAFAVDPDGIRSGTRLIGPMLLIQSALSPLFVWLRSRLMLAAPVMARAGSINPVPAMRRSWGLTRSWQWRLFGLQFAAELTVSVLIAVLFLLHLGYVTANPVPTTPEWALTLAWPVLFALIFIAVVAVPVAILRRADREPLTDMFA